MIVWYLYSIFLFLFFAILKKPPYIGMNLTKAVILVIITVLFFGLRNTSIGLDSKQYINIFRNIDMYPSKLEAGFVFFIKLCNIVTNNEKLFIVIFTFFINGLLMTVYYKINKNYCFYYFCILSCYYYYYQFHRELAESCTGTDPGKSREAAEA